MTLTSPQCDQTLKEALSATTQLRLKVQRPPFTFQICVLSLCVHKCTGPTLTVHGHAHCDALLEAAELTLVAGNLVDDAAAIVLTGVGGVEVLLNGPTEETLEEEEEGGMGGMEVKGRRQESKTF